MSEVERILDQLRRSFERQSWHGSAVLELLEGITAAESAYRPARDVHSIGELVAHMTTWKRIVTARIQGRVFDPTPEEDWPRATRARFAESVAELVAAHRELMAAAGALEDDTLDQPSSPPNATRYLLLHGVVQHDLYHAGQIAVLRKLARSGV